jgi:hypothetical protein
MCHYLTLPALLIELYYILKSWDFGANKDLDLLEEGKEDWQWMCH